MLQNALDIPSEWVHLTDPVDFIAEKFDPIGRIIGIRRKNFNHVAAHTEFITNKIDIVALILNFNELMDDVVPLLCHTRAQGDHHAAVINRVAQAIDAGDARHDNHIPPLGQCRGGGVAQLIDFIVDGGILFDIGIGCGNVSFRLIIVIIGDKIFHSVFREKFAKLAAQLRRQCFIVRQNQRWTVHLFDHVCHSEGFAGAGHAHQNLFFYAIFKALHQLIYGLWLIACGPIFGNQFEWFFVLHCAKCLLLMLTTSP